jgi:hypothetical protein
MRTFAELRHGEVPKMHYGRTSGAVELHPSVTILAQQGTEIQDGSSSILVCTFRLTLIKIGSRVKELLTKIRLFLASRHPGQSIWEALSRLSPWDPFPGTDSKQPCWCRPPNRTSPCRPNTVRDEYSATQHLSCRSRNLGNILQTSQDPGLFACWDLYAPPQHDRSRSRGVVGLRSHPRASQSEIYARSCKRTSENSTSTHSGE